MQNPRLIEMSVKFFCIIREFQAEYNPSARGDAHAFRLLDVFPGSDWWKNRARCQITFQLLR